MAPSDKQRFSKEKWLGNALEQLAKSGRLGLTIEELSMAVGVTKGSFYWHFRNRDEFVRNLFDYWAELSTASVIEHVEQGGGSGSERLLALTEFLIREDICRYELPIRGWVQIHPVLTPLLEEIDLKRYEYVAALFKEIGFTDNELEMRVRTFLVFYGLETSLYPNQTREERLALSALRHEWLTRNDAENV